MKTGWKVHTQYEPYYAGHSMWMLHEDHLGRSIVKRIEMESIVEGQTSQSGEQPIPMDQVEDFIRAVMDAGWEMGLRPTGYENHENELKATRDHLQDMRVLAKVVR